MLQIPLLDNTLCRYPKLLILLVRSASSISFRHLFGHYRTLFLKHSVHTVDQHLLTKFAFHDGLGLLIFKLLFVICF